MQLINLISIFSYALILALVGYYKDSNEFFIYASFLVFYFILAAIFLIKKLSPNKLIKTAFWLSYAPILILLLFFILQIIAAFSDKIFDISGEKTFAILAIFSGLATVIFIALSFLFFLAGLLALKLSKTKPPL